MFYLGVVRRSVRGFYPTVGISKGDKIKSDGEEKI